MDTKAAKARFDAEQVDALTEWAAAQEWTLNELVAVCLFVASEGVLLLSDDTDAELLEWVQ